MEKFDRCEKLIKGITHIGRARTNHKQNSQEALRDLKFGIELINESVELSPSDIFLRRERVARFLGITLNSPLNLIETVEQDIKFFKDNFNSLDREYRSFYAYITGLYNINFGDKELGIKRLQECITFDKNSLESKEAKTLLATIDSNLL